MQEITEFFYKVTAPLTPAQRRMFFFVLKGLLNKQIAYSISSNENVVKMHMVKILKATKTKSRASAICFFNIKFMEAIANGYFYDSKKAAIGYLEFLKCDDLPVREGV